MHCGFCGKDELRGVTDTEHFEYRGRPLEVAGYTYSVCKACGEEVVTSEQMKLNQRLVADAKRRVDGFLTSTEIRQLRERLGLSQVDAGRVFGGGPNAFYKYENGEVMQSQALDRLMLLARDNVWAYQRLRAIAGLQEMRAAEATQTMVFVITPHGGGPVRVIDADRPVGAPDIVAQAFLGAVSNQTKSLVENVQFSGSVH